VSSSSDLDEQLARAYADWAAARDTLDALRRQLPGGARQMANTPEVASLFTSIQAQQDECERLFAILVQVAETRSAALEREALRRAAKRVRDRGPGG
jgi:hypothetical protein